MCVWSVGGLDLHFEYEELQVSDSYPQPPEHTHTRQPLRTTLTLKQSLILSVKKQL